PRLSTWIEDAKSRKKDVTPDTYKRAMENIRTHPRIDDLPSTEYESFEQITPLLPINQSSCKNFSTSLDKSKTFVCLKSLKQNYFKEIQKNILGAKGYIAWMFVRGGHSEVTNNGS
ncbi:18227_t:CDS:1, partial [Gigaspora rosea]